MAVIASKQDTTLATASQFVSCYAYNLSMENSTTFALTTTRIIPLTFSSNSNCAGAVLCLEGGENVANDRNVNLELQQKWGTVTISNATPAVITATGHSLAEGALVGFSTTGALPTGLSVDVRYYVRNPGVNVFNVSLTPAGALINTSSAGSGTHSLWETKATKTLASTEINPFITTETSNYGEFLKDFAFSSAVAVTTSASTFQFRVTQTDGTTGTWYLRTSDGTTFCYCSYSDNAVSPADNDTLIIKNKVVIDKDFTVKGTLGTGSTAYGIAVWLCSNTAEVVKGTNSATGLVWENSFTGAPVSSYTFTIDGLILMSSNSSFICGSSSYPITYAQKAIIKTNARTVGTVASGFYHVGRLASAAQRSSRMLFQLYGAIPTRQFALLTSQAATGQAVLNIDRDVSATWSATDTLMIAKSETQGIGTVTQHAISSMTSSSITLSANLATNNRASGGAVLNLSGKYGIWLTTDASTTIATNVLGMASVFDIIGCNIYQWAFSFAVATTSLAGKSPNNGSQWNITDNTWWNTGAFLTALTLVVPPLGAIVRRNYTSRCRLALSYTGYYASASPVWKSGFIYVQNNIETNLPNSSVTTWASNVKIVYSANKTQNAGASSYFIAQGIAPLFYSNYFYGTSATISVGGAVTIGQSVNALFTTNYFDNCAVAYQVGSYATIGFKSYEDLFGSETANTTDIGIYGSNYVDVLFSCPDAVLNIDTTYLPDLTPGSAVKINEDNCVDMAHTAYYYNGIITPSGTGLADTTCHTAGGYALRQQSTDSGNSFMWEQDVPTGNIQNMTMSVAVWCKVNSTAYNAGTNILPQLTVRYDDSVSASATYPNTTPLGTDWVLLSVSFMPTTTFGKIEVILSSQTDAVGSDAYVYWDDLSIFYPAGYQLHMGDLDLWAEALPVTPSISTNLGAHDVWDIPISGMGASTTGDALNQTLKTGTFMALK